MQTLSLDEVKKIINNALNEDFGENGDITSNLTIQGLRPIEFQIATREEIILCGAEIALMVFEEVGKRFKTSKNLIITKKISDKKKLKKGDIILKGKWDAKSVFAAERVALNLLQHLSAIATKTSKYVAALNNKKIKILDTRKTIPGIRILQKYAVKTGGGENHRLNLSDGILIKDNHIAAAGGVTAAIKLAQKNLSQKIKIEVECDDLNQVQEAVKAKADIIMLDNMNISQIKKAILIINKKSKIEISGGITLKNLKSLSNLNINYISIGALTHSVDAADIGLDIISNEVHLKN